MEAAELLQSILTKAETVPVLVDFWAPWCGPCKVLGPIVEKLAAEADGRWELIKVNVDDHQELAAQFAVQSIPSLKLIYQQQLLGDLGGAVPEPELVEWLEEHLPEGFAAEGEPEAPTAGEAQLTELLDAFEFEKALPVLNKILVEEDSGENRINLAKALVFSQPAEAVTLLESMHEDSDHYDAAVNVRSFAAVLQLDPESLTGPCKPYMVNAAAALKKPDFPEALEHLLDVLYRDRAYADEGARKACIAIFALVGRDHEITKTWHRRFEMAMFA